MKISKEIESCFSEMESLLKQSFLNEFMRCEAGALSRYHFGFGLWIRSHFLTEENDVCLLFSQDGAVSKDDMSMRVIRLFHAYLQTKYLNHD